MQIFFFRYFLYPFLYLIASLPFWFLYRLSDFFFLLIYYVFGYRKKVVFKNLRNAFPEKSEKEIRQIARKFYLFLCDMIFETLKMLTISKKEMNRRMKLHDLDVIAKIYQQKKSILMMLGHSGSWEWASPAFELQTDYHVLVIYKSLSNKNMDNLVVKLRTRFGQEVVSMKNTLRAIISLKNQLTVTALAADQRPEPKDAYWTKFFNQDTGFLWGTEKLAQKFDYPVLFAEITRPCRGFYEIHFEMLCEKPKETGEGEITEKFVRRLETQIRLNPEIWLWSHDRWKHQKPKD